MYGLCQAPLHHKAVSTFMISLTPIGVLSGGRRGQSVVTEITWHLCTCMHVAVHSTCNNNIIVIVVFRGMPRKYYIVCYIYYSPTIKQITMITVLCHAH